MPELRRPAALTQVLGTVYRAIAGLLIKKAGVSRCTADTGAVTLVQRFGSALNVNLRFHMLVLDGVYIRAGEGVEFRRPSPPTCEELETLVQRI